MLAVSMREYRQDIGLLPCSMIPPPASEHHQPDVRRLRHSVMVLGTEMNGHPLVTNNSSLIVCPAIARCAIVAYRPWPGSCESQIRKSQDLSMRGTCRKDPNATRLATNPPPCWPPVREPSAGCCRSVRAKYTVLSRERHRFPLSSIGVCITSCCS